MIPRFSREFKFRAYSKSTGDVRDVMLIDWVNALVDLSGGEIEHNLEDVDLMQFTGLKDDSGNEIYEGDILQISERFGDAVIVGKVDWGLNIPSYGSYPAFTVNSFESDMNSFSEMFDSGAYNVEVIGNIYENPELLKKSRQ